MTLELYPLLQVCLRTVERNNGNYNTIIYILSLTTIPERAPCIAFVMLRTYLFGQYMINKTYLTTRREYIIFAKRYVRTKHIN